jgi:hypothetical protein
LLPMRSARPVRRSRPARFQARSYVQGGNIFPGYVQKMPGFGHVVKMCPRRAHMPACLRGAGEPACLGGAGKPGKHGTDGSHAARALRRAGCL